jgi:hypothetical protein
LARRAKKSLPNADKGHNSEDPSGTRAWHSGNAQKKKSNRNLQHEGKKQNCASLKAVRRQTGRQGKQEGREELHEANDAKGERASR